MGIMITLNNLTLFSKSKDFRNDFKYINFIQNSPNEFYLAKDLFQIIEYKKIDLENLKNKENFKYCEIGNVSKDGDINPVLLSFDDRNELNENYFKKIEKGDIILPQKEDILISSIRPYLTKNVYIDYDEEIYYTKAFIQIRPLSLLNSELLYYYIKVQLHNNFNKISRIGKGYPILNIDDLKTLKFPKNEIDILIKNKDSILKKIEKYKIKNKNFNIEKKDDLEIINAIFSEKLDINLIDLKEKVLLNKIYLNYNEISSENITLRNSFRWNKIQILQNFLYKDLTFIEKLDKYILEIKNGWSPSISEDTSGTCILGQDSFQKNGVISQEVSKYTSEIRSNIDDFYIKKDDIFVSRGNTSDLVGLCGIIEEEPSEKIIYPDLFIKIVLDKKRIIPKYLCYLFNSFLGRLYFKYVSKGKNQTMVKISSSELRNFKIPIPDLKLQKEIVTSIENQLKELEANQSKINQEKEELHNFILKLITNK